jgi:hypothetical protein
MRQLNKVPKLLRNIWEYIADNKYIWAGIGLLFLIWAIYIPTIKTITALLICDSQTNASIIDITTHYKSLSSTKYSYIINHTNYIVEDSGSWGVRKNTIEIVKYYSKNPIISYLPKMVIETLVYKLVLSGFSIWMIIMLCNVNHTWGRKSKNINIKDVYASNEMAYLKKIEQFMNQTK